MINILEAAILRLIRGITELVHFPIPSHGLIH
jgi:hypothetical protein